MRQAIVFLKSHWLLLFIFFFDILLLLAAKRCQAEHLLRWRHILPCYLLIIAIQSLFLYRRYRPFLRKARSYLSSGNDMFSSLPLSEFSGYQLLLWTTAMLLISFPVVTAGLTILTFSLGIGVAAWHLPVSFLLCALTVVLAAKRPRWTVGLGAIALSLLIIIPAIYIANANYELWHDAMAYHHPAAFAMADGWNPIRDFFGFHGAATTHVIHLPKAQWYNVAACIKLFHSAESGCFTHFILIAATFFFALVLLKNCFGFLGWHRFLLAIAIALNPIAVEQLYTGYIDGLLASALTITFLGFLGYCFSSRFWTLLPTIPAIIFVCNLKPTGCAYVVLFSVGFILIRILFLRRPVGALIKTLIICAVLSLLYGVNPYYFNTVEMHNPLYPFVGDENFNPARTQRVYAPLYHVEGRSTVYQIGLLQLLSNGSWGQSPAPLAKSRFDYSLVIGPMDPYAFGPLFGPMLILSLLLLIPLFKGRRIRTLVVVLLTLATILVVPLGFIGRYMPQLYFLPCLLCAAVFLRSHATSVWHGLASFLLAGLVLNSLMIGFVISMEQREHTKTIQKMFDKVIAEDAPNKEYWYVVARQGDPLGQYDFHKSRFRECTGKELQLRFTDQLPPNHPGLLHLYYMYYWLQK